MLSRAFGSPTTQRVMDLRAVDASCRMGLAERIWSRTPAETLSLELGAAAQALAHAHLAALAAHRQAFGALEKVVQVAERRGIPVVLLKFGALVAAGHTARGSRDARDLDVLVPAPMAQGLQDGLLARGMRPLTKRAPPHHLPGLRNELGEAVEVHRYIPGLYVDEREVEAPDLLHGGWTEVLAAGGGNIHVPVPEVLAAHAIVHGLIQHRDTPLDYSLARMLSDLSDLGLSGGALDSENLANWFGSSISENDIAAIVGLIRTLTRGGLPEPGSAELTLLRHVVASSCDPEYQDRLRIRRIMTVVRSGQFARVVRDLRLDGNAALGRPARAGHTPGSALSRFARLARALFTEARVALQPAARRAPARKIPAEE